MTTLANHILALPGWVALLVVFAVPALESSAFVGFLFPGEIALILGGVLAFEGRVPLAAVLVAGMVGAVVGDSVGYAVGSAYGRRLLDGTVGRWVKQDHLDRASVYLAERGGRAVFFGRFTAALRVMIPGLAGMSGLRYRTFLVFNVAGAVGWVTLSVMLGYLGGSSWRHVEHIASRIGLGALAVVVLAIAAGYALRRTGTHKGRRLLGWLESRGPVRRARARHPRLTGWLTNRLDPSRPTGLGLTIATAVLVGSVWAFLGISQDVVVNEELALADPGIHSWFLAHRTGALDTFFQIVTRLGSTYLVVPLLLVAGAALVRRRRSWVPAVDIAVVYGSAVLLHAVVIELVHRPRPPRADWLAPAGGWAYPSGHTTQAVAAWGLLALLFSVGAAPRTRTVVVSAAAVVVTLVAVSRVYLGVHWATDVLGAVAMSVAVLSAWVVVHRFWFVDPPTHQASPSGQVSGGNRWAAAHAASEHRVPRASRRRPAGPAGIDPPCRG
ncbi:bifunctional DedA family/phosphatase PAP2 family protein [Nocardioides mesophilus]|uniref:Bifunctional DedA family/phosphatase PAP2 family protein n=1 Tax=Nocardioides mesophilus TaxID=433659 RepID=A0A7G9RCH0_9ACTN|nr:bifunctional DedA family/phosphatase PAP2 family protein [Nocardioides mesophilus]QNN53295.1 bifunctional DedA family/phosphatase PAP2 family protein [Nocardioides mesophilus]